MNLQDGSNESLLESVREKIFKLDHCIKVFPELNLAYPKKIEIALSANKSCGK